MAEHLNPQQWLDRAQYLSHVLTWIEDARMTLARLEDARSTNEAIDAALTAQHVSIPMDWTEHESNGLHELHEIQREAMREAGRAFDGAA